MFTLSFCSTALLACLLTVPSLHFSSSYFTIVFPLFSFFFSLLYYFPTLLTYQLYSFNHLIIIIIIIIMLFFLPYFMSKSSYIIPTLHRHLWSFHHHESVSSHVHLCTYLLFVLTESSMVARLYPNINVIPILSNHSNILQYSASISATFD